MSSSVLKVDSEGFHEIPYSKEVTKLDSLQEAVGGYIEFVQNYLPQPYVMVIDEEGLIKNKPLTATINDVGIRGTILIYKQHRTPEDIELLGLTDNEILQVKEHIRLRSEALTAAILTIEDAFMTMLQTHGKSFDVISIEEMESSQTSDWFQLDLVLDLSDNFSLAQLTTALQSWIFQRLSSKNTVKFIKFDPEKIKMYPTDTHDLRFGNRIPFIFHLIKSHDSSKLSIEWMVVS